MPTPGEAFRMLALIAEQTPLLVGVVWPGPSPMDILRPPDLPLEGYHVGLSFTNDELILAYCLIAEICDDLAEGHQPERSGGMTMGSGPVQWHNDDEGFTYPSLEIGGEIR